MNEDRLKIFLLLISLQGALTFLGKASCPW